MKDQVSFCSTGAPELLGATASVLVLFLYPHESARFYSFANCILQRVERFSVVMYPVQRICRH